MPDAPVSSPPLWRHQIEAVRFARGKRAAVLEMGMGTGKTATTTRLLDEWDAGLTVVFCPLSVVPHWPREVAKWSERAWRVEASTNGTIRKRLERADRVRGGKPALVVLNYEALNRAETVEWVVKAKPDVVVYDELHRIKAPEGVQSRAAAKLVPHCGARLGLTGTLFPHSPLDAFGEYRAIDPQVFGWNWYGFRARYGIVKEIEVRQAWGKPPRKVRVLEKDRGGAIKIRDIDGLVARILPLTFRVDRSVLDLPETTHVVVEVTLSPKARRAYDALVEDMRVELKTGEINVSNALTKLLRLQQLTSGYAATDGGGEVLCTAKREAVVDLLDASGGEPFVIFCRYKHELAEVHEAAKLVGSRSLELSGSRRELEMWQGGEAPILAVQVQSGSLGIDLTRARYAAFMSTGFDLGLYDQALARVHRPGQTRPVTYYSIEAMGTIDTRCREALSARRDAILDVLEMLRRGE